MSSVTLRLHASRLRCAIDAQPFVTPSAGLCQSRVSSQLPDGLASAQVRVYRLPGIGVVLQRVSGAPNNSFKPSPHRYGLLSDGWPGRAGLTQALGA